MSETHRFVVEVIDNAHDNKRVVYEGHEVSESFIESYIERLAKKYKHNHSLCLYRETPHPVTGKPSFPLLGFWVIENSKLMIESL